jgi:2-dehydro-3-deoxyphosphogluconate aldolase/(4S)-4-hydroxy-2-oxoglutarate aldolase
LRPDPELSAQGLIAGLSTQPLLVVLRPRNHHQARRQLDLLLAAGLVHVELAVEATEAWVSMARSLVADFPTLRLGVASVRCDAHLDAAQAAGLRYAVSPVLDRSLLERARASALPLVPGVMTPSEVHRAVQWGARLVKLFPAQAIGIGYWRSLQGPLGPLPFCIAAGGLTLDDVEPWLAAGVDAVAVGSSLFGSSGGGRAAVEGSAPSLPQHPHDLPGLLSRLRQLRETAWRASG